MIVLCRKEADVDIQYLIRRFDMAINDPRTYREIFKSESKDAYDQIDRIESIRFKAIAGSRDAEKYMIEKLCRFIYLFKDTEDIRIIDFDAPENNSEETRLILLLETVELYDVLQIYCTDDIFDKDSLDKAVEGYREEIKQRFSNIRERTEMLARIMFSNVYGLGIIDFLRGRFINEIGIIRKDYIYIITRGRKIRIKAVAISSNEALQNILKKATLKANRPFDMANPITISSRDNTDRVAVAGFAVTPDENESYINIRIFNLESITLEELRDKYNTLDAKMFDFLELNQKGKGSFFITGADMNVGKSTMLLAMLEKTPKAFGIGVIDPQNEMRLGVKYPDKNTITLISNDLKTTDECFEYLLKTSRDVISVSEITNSDEATQLINGALRLNCGICATMHSLDPGEVLTNLRNLMMRTDMYTNEKAASDDIIRGIDLIIHLKRIKEKIVVESIDELTPSGLCRLFSYENDDWKIRGIPSERYRRKLLSYLSEKDIEIYEEIFRGAV